VGLLGDLVIDDVGDGADFFSVPIDHWVPAELRDFVVHLSS
jgi:hypothetical protein